MRTRYRICEEIFVPRNHTRLSTRYTSRIRSVAARTREPVFTTPVSCSLADKRSSARGILRLMIIFSRNRFSGRGTARYRRVCRRRAVQLNFAAAAQSSRPIAVRVYYRTIANAHSYSLLPPSLSSFLLVTFHSAFFFLFSFFVTSQWLRRYDVADNFRTTDGKINSRPKSETCKRRKPRLDRATERQKKKKTKLFA